ncbi:phosphoribosylformylglycinamidine synthase subunit PurQ [Geminicoccaceae bacterium 1502E]|nr:phosphoribosylformylglycinamidine synthase subunit PurQ [Geminicoccaceae bacterium 1502E]
MRAAVITFPGSNCDRDLAVAMERCFDKPVARIWHQDTDLPPLDLIGIPGGFSFGDYLRCGAIAARSPVMREVARQAGRGVAVLGICNGFQVLTEAGLLPGALLRNSGLGFVCRTVAMQVATASSPFTGSFAADAPIALPVAHHDGNYQIDEDGLKRLEDEDRVAFRYLENPNGSMAGIAGVLSERRNVLGMMPHPERAIEPLLGGSDGLPLFRSLMGALA